MFVANNVELGVPFVTARPRLMELIACRALADASRAAFDEGLAQLAHLAQPDRPSPARLIRVRSLRPAHSPDRVTRPCAGRPSARRAVFSRSSTPTSP